MIAHVLPSRSSLYFFGLLFWLIFQLHEKHYDSAIWIIMGADFVLSICYKISRRVVLNKLTTKGEVASRQTAHIRFFLFFFSFKIVTYVGFSYLSSPGPYKKSQKISKLHPSGRSSTVPNRTSSMLALYTKRWKSAAKSKSIARNTLGHQFHTLQSLRCTILHDTDFYKGVIHKWCLTLGRDKGLAYSVTICEQGGGHFWNYDLTLSV